MSTDLIFKHVHSTSPSVIGLMLRVTIPRKMLMAGPREGLGGDFAIPDFAWGGIYKKVNNQEGHLPLLPSPPPSCYTLRV